MKVTQWCKKTTSVCWTKCWTQSKDRLVPVSIYTPKLNHLSAKSHDKLMPILITLRSFLRVRVTRLKHSSIFQFAASIAGLVLDKLNFFFFHFRGYPNRSRNPSLFNSAASFASLVLDKANFFLLVQVTRTVPNRPKPPFLF